MASVNQNVQPKKAEVYSIDELCPIHHVEYVAYDQESGQTLCNGCIYDKKYDHLVFNAVVAKKLQAVYDEKFAQYKKSLQRMQGVSSDLIASQLQGSMQSFFGNLKAHIQSIHQDVLSRLRNSKNLRELEDILKSAESYFNDSQTQSFKMEKDRFEQTISQGKYAMVAINKCHYDRVISKLDNEASRLEKVASETEARMGKVLKIKRNSDLVQKKMCDILDHCMEIDPGRQGDNKQYSSYQFLKQQMAKQPQVPQQSYKPVPQKSQPVPNAKAVRPPIPVKTQNKNDDNQKFTIDLHSAEKNALTNPQVTATQVTNVQAQMNKPQVNVQQTVKDVRNVQIKPVTQQKPNRMNVAQSNPQMRQVVTQSVNQNVSQNSNQQPQPMKQVAPVPAQVQNSNMKP